MCLPRLDRFGQSDASLGGLLMIYLDPAEEQKGGQDRAAT